MAANRAEIFKMMTTRAAAMRQSGESEEQAMMRFVETVQGGEMARLYQAAEPAPAEPVNVSAPTATVSPEKQRAMNAIEEAATAYREEHPDMTHEQAVMAVVGANPDLYAEYLDPKPVTLQEVKERLRKAAEEWTGHKYGVEMRNSAGVRLL